eukprot:CAMPEP_0194377868 /NCGR_PEP_ID=MMETSP0174-20130528/32751_1 /TAXON_ID=216777 /ORGANISM="Proboscia alata, Strain PI-D3" /LENGTH=606 /DNA_ID=CAMNT_0039159501 /DNA_START=104 /DNA_END=1924 /DNA_ORIENTATION=+
MNPTLNDADMMLIDQPNIAMDCPMSSTNDEEMMDMSMIAATALTKLGTEMQTESRTYPVGCVESREEGSGLPTKLNSFTNDQERSEKDTSLADVHGKSKQSTSDSSLKFPQVLMEILDNPAYNSIIAWLPHGEGFIIHNKKKFASDIIPVYFRKSHFTSFTRKLNRWGYCRACKGPEAGAYYHKSFKRGNSQLCSQMHCLTLPSDVPQFPIIENSGKASLFSNIRNEYNVGNYRPLSRTSIDIQLNENSQTTLERKNMVNLKGGVVGDIAQPSSGSPETWPRDRINNVVTDKSLYNALLRQQRLLNGSELVNTNSVPSTTSTQDRTLMAALETAMENDPRLKSDVHEEVKKQLYLEAQLNLARLQSERFMQKQAFLSNFSNGTVATTASQAGFGHKLDIAANARTPNTTANVEGLLELARLQTLINLKKQQQSIASISTTALNSPRPRQQCSVSAAQVLDMGNNIFPNDGRQWQHSNPSVLNKISPSNECSSVAQNMALGRILMERFSTNGGQPNNFASTNEWNNHTSQISNPSVHARFGTTTDANHLLMQRAQEANLINQNSPEALRLLRLRQLTASINRGMPEHQQPFSPNNRPKRRGHNASAA